MPYSRGRPSSGPSIISMLSDRYKEPDSAQTQPAGAGRPRIAYGQTTTAGGGGAGKAGSHQRTEETTYSFSQEEEIRQDGRTVYKTKEEKSFSEKPRPWPGENAAPAPKVSIKTISLSTKAKDDGQPAKLTNSFGGQQKDSFSSVSGQPHRQDYHYQQTISTKTQIERGGIPQQQQPQIHQIQQQSVYQQQKQPTYGQQGQQPSYQQQQVSSTQQQQQSSYGQQKQPSYTQQQQQPSYGQQKQPSYTQKQQPSYAQQQQQPSYGQQKQPSYAQQQQQPSYGEQKQPSYGQPQQPSYAQKQQQPGYGQQKQPSYAQPQQPSYTQQQQPSYGQPKPTHQQQPLQQQQQPSFAAQQASYAQVQQQQRPGYQLLQQQLQEQQRQQQQQVSYQQQPQQQPKQQASYQQQPQQQPKLQASYQQQPQQQQKQQASYQQQQQQQKQQASYQQQQQQKQASYQQQQQEKQQASYQQQQKQQVSYQQQQQQPQQRHAHPQPQQQQPQQQQYQQSVHSGVYRQSQPSVATITTITATSTTSTFAPPPTTTTTTTTGEPFPWEDEPELGVYENQPEQRPDLVRESDRNWQAELPTPGKARNLKEKFLTGDLENRSVVRRRELTPPSMVGGGVFENEPVYNPDVVHAEEYQNEPMPERGTARYMADRFKQMGRTVYPSGPTPPKREITPDRTTRGEYVSEPRGFVETYEGRPESGVFESEPVYLEDVIKADEYEDDRLPEQGLARNIAAHFREVGRYRPPPSSSRPKEFTPPREEGTLLQGYGVYENMPQYDPTVVHAEDQSQDILPERGTARTIVTRFRKMSSGDSTPKSPRYKKEFTPPRDGGGVYENNPTQFIPEYNRRPESGVLENEPQVRYDVVRADQPPPFEVELPERGMARSLVTTWRHKESTSSRATPTGSGKPKEFTPPREEPRVLLQRASSVGYDGFGISEGSVHPNDLPGQYQPLAEASVFESEPVYLEGVYREADTDWMEGMPRQDVTRKMVAKFRHIQQQSSTDVPDYASPAARPPVPAGRQAQNIRY